MKNLGITLRLTLIVMVTALCPLAQAQVLPEYPDVPRDHWAFKALNTMSQVGLLEGDPDGDYRGNRPLSRHEFPVAMVRFLTGRHYIGKPPQPFIFN